MSTAGPPSLPPSATDLGPGADELDSTHETRPLPLADLPEAAQRVQPHALPTIGQIGRYDLKYVIGEGGLGTVYAAYDPVLSRLIAIKTLHVDLPQEDLSAFNAMFLNEARAVAGLSHPHLVTVHDAGVSEHGAYIAMALLKGKDLRQLLAMGWRPTPAQAALIVRRLADALAYAHHKGVIHRDIKPANVFMTGRTQPCLLDFGIARIRQAERLGPKDAPESQLQEIVGGSPYYMSPEQLRREPVDARVDVYALGVLLYELLAGKRPFSGDSLEAITESVLRSEVPPVHEVNSAVPPSLSDIVSRAMHRDPAQRIRSARRLAQALRAWLVTQDDARRGASAVPAPAPAREARVRKGLGWLAGIGWAMALGGAGWAWLGQRPDAGTAEVAELVAPASGVTASDAGTGAPAGARDAAEATGPVETVEAAGSEAASAQAAEGAEPTAPAATPATVELAVSPWGEIWVNGAFQGVTPPLTQLSLPPGQHELVIRNGESPDHRVALTVRAGQTLRVQHRF